MKRIVVCCDGTWNRPDQPSPTNVTKLALAVAPSDGRGTPQRVYYHTGVGAGRFDHLRGGALGWGLSRNVKDAYRYLIENYQPDDELFFFGFSRGAYTVRSLAGLIRNSGLLRREYADRIELAYKLYRRRDKDSNPRANEAELFRRTYALQPRFKCIGVWDTVGSLGIPPGPLGWLNAWAGLRFHDTELSSHVDNAFHALALDERRAPFAPAIWRQQSHAKDQRLEQVWFPGVHSNVGGGYADSGLSDIAFMWMKERAEQCGLAFDPDYVAQNVHPNVGGELRDSMTPFYRLWGPHQRVPTTCEAPTFESVHPSAYERRDMLADYRPTNLPPLPPPARLPLHPAAA